MNLGVITKHSCREKYIKKIIKIFFINKTLKKFTKLTFKLFNIKAPFVCWKVVFFKKVNSGKVNYFSMFGSVMENTFQSLVMS